jgi:ribonuclease-3
MRFSRLISTPLEKKLGYRFKDLRLLEVATTHSSYANEHGLEADYERLEFLGDAVLGLVTAEWLFERYPLEPEGHLSKLKSSLVSTRSLAKHARAMELGPVLQLGIGEERSGGRTKRSLLADSMEAVFGAVYLDGGMKAARKVIQALLENGSAPVDAPAPIDAKTELQELLQARGQELPEYHLAAEEGPDHNKRFTVECRVNGQVLGAGEGRSKKIAEQVAAAAALDTLGGLGE